MPEGKQILIQCHFCGSHWITKINGDMPVLVDCSWYIIDNKSYIPSKTIFSEMDPNICPTCGLSKI